MGKIGVKNLYLHKILTDTSSAYTTDTAYSMVNKLISLEATPTTVEAVLDADDAVQERAVEVSSWEVSMELTDLTPDDVTLISGSSNVGNLNVMDDGSSSPYFAISWQETYTSSITKYLKFFKLKFEQPTISSKTKKESGIEYFTAVLKGKAIKRTYTGDSASVALYGVQISSDDANYIASIGSAWHNTGGLGTLDTTAPTISSVVPADEATGISADSTVVWTFDLPLNAELITSANFILFKESDDSIVAGALTYDTAQEVITFTPTASLTSAALYKALVTTNVKTQAGTALAANSIIEFTIA